MKHKLPNTRNQRMTNKHMKRSSTSPVIRENSNTLLVEVQIEESFGKDT